MRLKKIRLAGFKSFVDPTNIPFPGDMTAVVGPNGCGKSNVIDAVRWVLGESSAKNLRGDSMTDVIFNGSSARKPVSQCSVELVFDNTSGRIQGEFAAFNEISVKRIVTKEAVSSYWLNNAKCRRRDITDLFLGTGLGPRSYAIIEQGMISKLIESKPQDLRIFIEEAAGISKYKERRKETQTRIAHTKENLDRLEDVRQELGDQIAKLKRQALAATRYTELKQQERQLKAELATIKWLAQSNIIHKLQTEITDKETTLETLASSQQGDESGLQALKNDQSLCKQAIDDMQQTLFATGTDITKLEQSQMFAQKRLAQIQAEIEQLKQSEMSLQQSLQQHQRELTSAQQALLDAEPQKDILEEQVFDIENKKYDIDEQLQIFLRNTKAEDDAYHNKKQALQQKHSQIQQSLATQQRLTSRINELNKELSEQNIDDIVARLQQAQQNLALAQQAITATENEKQNLNNTLKEIRQQLKDKQAQVLGLENDRMSNHAKLNALEEMQSNPSKVSEVLSLLNIDSALATWQYFEVQDGYEKAFNSALHDMADAYVLDASLTFDIAAKLPSNAPPLMFSESFVAHKAPNSLAALLRNDRVPDFTNDFLVADTLSEGMRLLSKETKYKKCVLKDGTLISQSSFIRASKGDNKVLRQAQIDALKQSILQQTPILEQAQQALQSLKEREVEFENLIGEANERCQSHKTEHQQYLLEQQNLLFQQEQYAKRNEKIVFELEQDKTELAQEEMSLELLSEQVEDMGFEVAELDEKRQGTQQESEMLQQQQQNIQIQFNQTQSKLHEHAMRQQQLQNSITVLEEQMHSKQVSYTNTQDKLSLLQAEAEDLLMPEHDQQEKLQVLLAQQEDIRHSLNERRELLSSIESDIIDLEKGQHGVLAKMDKIKAEIASIRIQSESARVRSQSHVEQLAELSQSVKDILESLPEDAEEKLWQANLDDVTKNLSRLGAVNLAAVDEYEQQSKRKQHLDDQNEDLTQALDTLENAMRKIDKETRTRFKHTFDQVNSDLKMLFPKVFGGGSAYLDLTGDDLLETGVSIMARPPGKKNSTIHLLSGGEKALTALSLVFAIFRLNPAPFCLLDEVDAPLDDANVGRFCRLVSEMSKSVQFIYITHNKVAMEMATHLTGVTMAEPGVSRMVAVDMEQALAIAE